MTEIIFVRTVHHYQSYDDFFRLAELAGFPVISANDLDLTRECAYIISPDNGDWPGHIAACEKKSRVRNAWLILWQLERPGLSGGLGAYGRRHREQMNRRLYDEVWVSDRRLADETGLRFVSLGSHPGLGQPGENKEWSVAHISYAIPRRQTVYSRISGMHPSQLPGPNGAMPSAWGDVRDLVLRGSRFGLAVHQDNHPFIEPLRLAVFAAYGLPTIMETSFDPWPYNSDVVLMANYDDLADTVNFCLRQDYGRWREMGQRMRDRMCHEFEFGKVVRKAVAERVWDWR